MTSETERAQAIQANSLAGLRSLRDDIERISVLPISGIWFQSDQLKAQAVMSYLSSFLTMDAYLAELGAAAPSDKGGE